MATRPFLSNSLLAPRFGSRHAGLVLAAAIATTTLLGGCKDPAVEQQARFEAEFRAVADQYASLLAEKSDLISSAPTDESLAALREIASRVQGLSGGSAAQQTSARDLAHAVHRTAGSIGLAKAATIEAALEAKRDIATASLRLANELDAIAEAAEAVDLSGMRDDAKAARDESAAAARAFEQRIRDLEGPARTLAGRIADGTARLNQLGQESAVLQRKARESTPVAALAFVEESAKIQSEARATQVAVGNDSINAEVVRIDAGIASKQLEGSRAADAAATAAMDYLGSLQTSVAGQAARMRDLAKELRAAADGAMGEIASTRSGALRDAYAAAADDFSKAKGDSSNFVDSMMAEELRLTLNELEGVAAQGRMLLASGGSGAAGEIRTAAEALIATLKERATAASDFLANAGEDPSLAVAKGWVDGIKKQADAMTVDALMNPPKVAEAEPRRGVGASGGSGKSGRSMSGVADASAIADLDAWVASVNEMQAAGKYEDVVKAIVGAVDTSTPVGKAMQRMTSGMMLAAIPLTKAMQSKFGVSALDVGQGGQLGVGKLEIVSNDGTLAEVSGSGTEALIFRKSAGGWQIDYLEGLKRRGLPEEQIGMMAPALDMMASRMVEMFEKAMNDVAAGIEDGTYATAEDASAALMEKMGGALGAMGGGGGGPGGGFGRPRN